MNIQQIKCPGCGGTVFSQPETSNVNQPETMMTCQHCGSGFRVNNPNYRPNPVVYTTINNYNTTYEEVSANPVTSSGWRNSSDRTHKVVRILSFIIGGLTVPLVIIIWVAWFIDPVGLPIPVPVIFTGLSLFFFFLGYRCGKELKRRGVAGF